MRIARTSGTGKNKPVCLIEVRTSKTVETRTLRYRKYQMTKRGLPENACGGRASYLIDGKAMCDRHAGAAALQHLVDKQRARSDKREIERPRCGCPSETVRRVLVKHGTCGMGGCPYGGDV